MKKPMRFAIYTILAHVVLGGLVLVLWPFTDTIAAQTVFAHEQKIWTDGTFARTDEQQSVIDQLVAQRAQALSTQGEAAFGDATEINVLLLGLDARVKEDNPRCDAIHMFTLNLEEWTVKITSVPRGTYAYIPMQLASNQYYMANACGTMGIDYGIEQIEKVTGIKHDYLVTVNFSQALGVFRQLKLPSTETLQWLRHRQSYAIGDPQRSHNQALFMKDAIVNYSRDFDSQFSMPLQYMIFTMVDTDMDFKTARVLIEGFMQSGIYDHPERIVLDMKPWHPVVDEHYDSETVSDDLQAKYNYIKPYLSSEDFQQRSLEDIQGTYISELETRFASNNPIDDVMERELWLQVEDEALRDDLQYRFMHRFVRENQDEKQQEMIDLVTSYILEMEALEKNDWAQKGRELLQTVVD